jgi:phosphoserine phosphatase RsbU/P
VGDDHGKEKSLFAKKIMEQAVVPLPKASARVLVVDDSRAQRHILTMQLRRWGYVVTESATADAAMVLCAAEDFDIVISDWMMPGLSGLDFCRAFRGLGRENYGYFILLTSKSEKTEIADGLEAGADDFLTKPVSSGEFRARLRAGERMVAMQAEVLAKNRVIVSTLVELQALYDSLDRDLIEARKLQQTLVRDRYRDYGAAQASLILRNSGRVGGDLVGSFCIDADRIAIYSIDVSGHGVASAMMTARLAGFLTGSSPDQNLVFHKGPEGVQQALPPDQVAERFNRLMLEEIQAEQYFTMAYAEVNLSLGQVRFVQAGHPHPMLIRKGGEVVTLGGGGLPIGLIPGATYDCTTVDLAPGDRLFLMSDGITECPLPSGRDFGEEGLMRSLGRSASIAGPALLEAIIWDLADQAGTDSFPDDVSGILLDYLREE